MPGSSRAGREMPGCALILAMAALPVSADANSVSRGHREAGIRPHTFADTVDVLLVTERGWAPAVAVALSFAGGHADDPPGAEGTAWLLGMVLERTAGASLAETGASVGIEVGTRQTHVTLLATRSDWAAAYRVLTRTLLGDAIDPSRAEQSRADLSGQLFFQHDAPVRSFELALQRMLLGAEHPSARAAMGSPASVSGITVAALEAARAGVYTPGSMRVAVAGAVLPEEAAAVVGAHRTRISGRDGAWTVEGAPLTPGGTGRTWETGGRYPVLDEITNSWIVAAYPFSGSEERAVFEFLAHVARGQLVSDPPAPGLISRRVEVRELPDGPVLLVTAAVESHTAPDWEDRVTDVVDRLSASGLALDLLEHQRRSFRSAMALELAYPEREVHRLLAGIRTSGRLTDLSADLELLSAGELQRAAGALGEPRMLVYGPGGPPL